MEDVPDTITQKSCRITYLYLSYFQAHFFDIQVNRGSTASRMQNTRALDIFFALLNERQSVEHKRKDAKVRERDGSQYSQFENATIIIA